MLVGYARVSTIDQETDLQIDALRRAGVRRVFTEKTSSVGRRPELQRALAYMRPGHTLVVYKLDRLARSLKDLLGLLDRLDESQFGLRSLTEPIDTSSPAGQLMLQVLGAVAQFERSLIRERTIAGQIAFARRGGVFGRPKKLTQSEEDALFVRYLMGERASVLARDHGVSRMVVQRVIDENLGRKKTGTCPVLSRYL